MHPLHRLVALSWVTLLGLCPAGQADARERLAPQQRDALLRALSKGGQAARNRAAARLYHFQDVAANAAICKMAAHPRATIRAAGVWALGAVRPRGAAPLVLRGLRDPQGSVRRAAADAAGMLRLAKAAPKLGRLLKDRQRPVRIAAIRALSRLREASLPTLKRALVAKGEIPLLAVEALARIPGRQSSRLLERAAHAPSLEIRFLAASKLLERFNPLGGQVLVRLLLQHKRAKTRARAATLLARDHSAAGRRALGRALRDPDRQVRRAAADALARRR